MRERNTSGHFKMLFPYQSYSLNLHYNLKDSLTWLSQWFQFCWAGQQQHATSISEKQAVYVGITYRCQGRGQRHLVSTHSCPHHRNKYWVGTDICIATQWIRPGNWTGFKWTFWGVFWPNFNLDQFSSFVHPVAVWILVPTERKKEMVAWQWQSEATSDGLCQD